MRSRTVAGAARAADGALIPPGEILDQAGIGIVVFSADGLLRYLNPAAAGLFGVADRPQELVGRSLASLSFEADDRGRIRDAERQVRRGRDWEGTLSIRLPDESVFFVRANSVPLRDGEGALVGAVVTVRQAVRLGDAIADRMGLLERIGERLSGSLEVDATMLRVAGTLVPQFADHCFIDLGALGQPGEPAQLVRRAVAHANGWMPAPGTWAAKGEQICYPPGHFCYQAMHQQETVLVEDVVTEDYPAPTPESMREGVEVGLTSVIAAPLIARGQVMGVISLALSQLTQRDGQRFGAGDRDFLAAIASRVAVAIDNALLFEEERATALAFQTSLLPHEPPDLDGIEVAYRYVPAKPLESHGQGIQTQVGGDWYDTIKLSAGRVGIVIGDVMGRGARAAALMGQLRSALRAFAQDDKAPAEIMRRLDDWCRTLVPVTADGLPAVAVDSPIVSCTYLVYDPWARRLTLANAGHLPPLIITEKGEVEQFTLEHEGVMLGVRGKGIPGVPPYREETRDLPPGAALVFYTDGLVDRRQRADGLGHYGDAEVFDMLRGAIKSAASRSVREIAEAAEAAVPGQIDDDMAIVVMRTAPEDLLWWEGMFPAEAIRVSDARRQARQKFLDWGMDREQSDLACLLVSEVVTNVVLHTSAAASPRNDLVLDSGSLAALSLDADLDDWEDSPFAADFGAGPGQEFVLRLRKGTTSVWVEVFDTDLRLPRIRAAGENDEGGRGLYLVEQLANKWGTRPTEDGKAVWFEMPMRRPAP